MDYINAFLRILESIATVIYGILDTIGFFGIVVTLVVVGIIIDYLIGGDDEE